MAKSKNYQFKDGSAYTSNKDIVAALGEDPHIRQISIVVSATSKTAALEALNKVGFGLNAREVSLGLSDSPRYQKLQAEGVLMEGTVLASSLLSREGDPIISLTPTEDRFRPQITKVAVVSYR